MFAKAELVLITGVITIILAANSVTTIMDILWKSKLYSHMDDVIAVYRSLP
jgi:hypothetical protein